MTKRKARKVWRVTVDFSRLGDRSVAEFVLKEKAWDAILHAVPGSVRTPLVDGDCIIVFNCFSKEEAEQHCRKVRKILQAQELKTFLDFSKCQVSEPEPWSCAIRPCPRCAGTGLLMGGHRVKF